MIPKAEVNKEWNKAVDHLISLGKRIPILERKAWEIHKIVEAWYRKDPMGQEPTNEVNDAINAHIYLLHRTQDIDEEIPKLEHKISVLSMRKRAGDLNQSPVTVEDTQVCRLCGGNHHILQCPNCATPQACGTVIVEDKLIQCNKCKSIFAFKVIEHEF